MTTQTKPEENNPEKPKLTKAQEMKQDLYFWLQALTMALVVLILLFTFVGRIISVDGESMLPTLHHGDMLLLRSIGYTPEQGDIVVLTKNFSHYVDQPIVKRVIAVGGQTVRIDYSESKVYVDGVALDEPYINEAIMFQPGGDLTISEMTVPEGSVFVMGDNRNNSSDSRHYQLGAIDTRYILGEAVMILLPFQDFGVIQ